MVKKRSSTTSAKQKQTITDIKQKMFLSSLKSLVEALSRESPTDILTQIYDYLDTKFVGMKEYLLTEFANKHSNENKEKLWNDVRNVYGTILQPLEVAKKQVKSNAMQEEAQKLNFAIKQYQFNKGMIESDNLPYWPKPMSITYINQKIANDVATINCKIGPMKIPYAMIDTGSNISVISDNIVKRLGLEINKNKKYEINGYATFAYTIGTINDIPITIENENDSVTQSDEFCVVKAEKDKNGKEKSLLVLGTPWLHKVGWEPLTNGEFKVNNNGKTLSIPLFIHKSDHTANGFNIEKNKASSFGSSGGTGFGIKKT